MSGFTSASQLAQAKRKHACDMGSVQRSQSARAPVVHDGGAVVGVMPAVEPSSSMSPKHTSAAELREEKAHHRMVIESPPRMARQDKLGAGPTNSWEEIREQKVKHVRQLPVEREGVLIGDEECTPNPTEDTRLVSVRQLNKEKKHHRHIIGKPNDPDSLKSTFRPADGPQGSQKQLEKLKKNHDHTLAGEFNGCSPQRDTSALVTSTIDTAAAVKSCSHLNSKKKYHEKDMTAPKADGKGKCVSNEEYNYEKKRHRHTVDVGSTTSSPNPNAKGPKEDTADGKCTSHRRMDRKKQLHSHTMDTHRGYSASPEASPEGAVPSEALSPAKVRSNQELHTSIKRHKHEIDGDASPSKPPAATGSAKNTSNTQLSRDIRGHKLAIDGGSPAPARPEIFQSSPPPVIANASAEA